MAKLAKGDLTKLTVEVTAQQGWWKARYLNSDASRVFTTANEIHIPTGHQS